MLKITELKASELKKLRAIGSTERVVELSKKDVVMARSYIMEHCEDVQHRGLDYTVGLWSGWEGDFWLVENATGDVFRGSLTYIKEMIVLCSAAKHEPHEFR